MSFIRSPAWQPSRFLLTGSVQVYGASVVTGTLVAQGVDLVYGTSVVTGTLATSGVSRVLGDAVVTGTMDVGGTSIVTGTLAVGGVERLIGCQAITGALDVAGVTKYQGTTSITGTLDVSGISRFQGTSAITGTVDLVGASRVTGTLGVSGVERVYGTAAITGTMDVLGTSILTGTLGVGGVERLIGCQAITGALDVAGVAKYQGITSITGTLDTQGTSKSQGTTAITGTLDVLGASMVTGTFGVNIERILSISAVTGTLDVSGVSKLQGTQAITGTFMVLGAAAVTGTLGVGGVEVVTGDSSVTGALEVSGLERIVGTSVVTGTIVASLDIHARALNNAKLGATPTGMTASYGVGSNTTETFAVYSNKASGPYVESLRFCANVGGPTIDDNHVIARFGYLTSGPEFTGSWKITPVAIMSDSPATAEILGSEVDGASAIGTIVGSSASFSTAGSKLLSIVNKDDEKEYVEYDGSRVHGISYFGGYTKDSYFSEIVSIPAGTTYASTANFVPAGSTIYGVTIYVLNAFQTGSWIAVGVSGAAAFSEYWGNSIAASASVDNLTSSMKTSWLYTPTGSAITLSSSVLQGSAGAGGLTTGSVRVECRYRYVSPPTS